MHMETERIGHDIKYVGMQWRKEFDTASVNGNTALSTDKKKSLSATL